jgi:phosphate transport system permease protein
MNLKLTPSPSKVVLSRGVGAIADPSIRPRPAAVRRRQKGISLLARGTAPIWLSGGAMSICLVMIGSLLAFILFQGVLTFWPIPIVKIATVTGATFMGEVTRDDTYRPEPAVIERLPEAVQAEVRKMLAESDGVSHRRLLRTGNYELTNEHFTWVSDFEIAPGGETRPPWALILERQAWGRFYGEPKAFLIDSAPAATDPEKIWSHFEKHHPESRRRWSSARNLEKHAIGEINYRLEQSRLKLREVELRIGRDSERWREQARIHSATEADLQKESENIQSSIQTLRKENARFQLQVVTADGREKTLTIDEIVRGYPANRIGILDKWRIYLSRWWEFLYGDPREANSEGGVFPAIFGTVVMTLLMSIAVVPFGVLAALYLREYAKSGPLVSSVRIAINNLAGVPSIVFGVFGLGFFSYIIGARIDDLFFSAKLPSPTFGTGGILWASLTLALLTLPVVIVATEEALAAVPSSMREGSYACGASKWQTIRRIVLPRAMPGVMTGMILAMARGAGEVAPLMLVGAVKLAPELPIDTIFPYVHLERSFMHLGFHIYDLGFQSQNSEAAKPMVLTTTLLLIVIIFFLNTLGVYLRSRLRRKFASSVF